MSIKARIHRVLSANDDNATVVHAKRSRIFGWYMSNSNASSARYLKLYDQNTAPDENDTPIATLMIPSQGGGNEVEIENEGIFNFDNGFAYRITTGAADNDTGAPAANEVILNILWLPNV